MPDQRDAQPLHAFRRLIAKGAREGGRPCGPPAPALAAHQVGEAAVGFTPWHEEPQTVEMVARRPVVIRVAAAGDRRIADAAHSERGGRTHKSSEFAPVHAPEHGGSNDAVKLCWSSSGSERPPHGMVVGTQVPGARWNGVAGAQ